MTKSTDIVKSIQRHVHAYTTITGQAPTTLYIDKTSYYTLVDAMRMHLRNSLVDESEQPMYQGMVVYRVDIKIPHIKVTHS